MRIPRCIRFIETPPRFDVPSKMPDDRKHFGLVAFCESGPIAGLAILPRELAKHDLIHYRHRLGQTLHDLAFAVRPLSDGHPSARLRMSRYG
jgi:hypothetical protein